MGSNAILERITKLLRHAESARELGSTAEAEAFAGRATTLLAQHGMSMSDVELDEYRDASPFAESSKVDPLGLSSQKAWLRQLARTIAYWNTCRTLIYRGSSAISFIGRPANRAATVEVFARLAQFAAFESKRQYNNYASRMSKAGTPHLSRGFRESWLTAFIETINKRLEEALGQAVQDEVHERGLILVDERNLLNEYMDKTYLAKATALARLSASNRAGIEAGVVAATNADLSTSDRRLK